MQLSSSEKVALAIDIGTTTIAASLVDIATGLRLAGNGCLNPQREFGADVITRLSVAKDSPELRHRMARVVNAELERLAMLMLDELGMARDCLRRVAIAGNPAMEHLLLDLPVDSLTRIPYRPLFTEEKMVRTGDLGWSMDLEAYIFPLPGGFVGGDLVAFLYGQMISDAPFTTHVSRIYLDLGTNAEIALTVGDRIYATSAAAGPAFEGGNLTHGMAALAGAISSVECREGKVLIETVGGGLPTGVCGSGALSAIASLRREGVIEASGRLRSPEEMPSNLANRLIGPEESRAFVLYRDARNEVTLTQEDIRQVQLAKGAIRAGIEVLLARTGMVGGEVGEVLMTGSFGMVLGSRVLHGLGIIPAGASSVRFVAAGALAGVERFFSREGGDKEMSALVSRLSVVPLSGNPLFEAKFIEYMDL